MSAFMIREVLRSGRTDVWTICRISWARDGNEEHVALYSLDKPCASGEITLQMGTNSTEFALNS